MTTTTTIMKIMVIIWPSTRLQPWLIKPLTRRFLLACNNHKKKSLSNITTPLVHIMIFATRPHTPPLLSTLNLFFYTYILSTSSMMTTFLFYLRKRDHDLDFFAFVCYSTIDRVCVCMLFDWTRLLVWREVYIVYT